MSESDGVRSGRGREDVPQTWRGPRRRMAPGPVLPCADPEPRAPRVIPCGPFSPSGPPPAEDLPAGGGGQSLGAVTRTRGVAAGKPIFECSFDSVMWWRRTGSGPEVSGAAAQQQRQEAAGKRQEQTGRSSGSGRSERARGCQTYGAAHRRDRGGRRTPRCLGVRRPAQGRRSPRARSPGVLLLHGLMGRASHWASTARWLAERHRAVALDQRGHGQSDKAPRGRRTPARPTSRTPRPPSSSSGSARPSSSATPWAP